MSDIAIRCENLSKQYRIGRMERYKTLRDTLADTMFSPFQRLRSAFNGSGREKDEDNLIWALKDVSFDVNRGDVVGIIGRNGAGKSTLLKILSRITEPTAGYAQIYGRVGSLLEVGTGFHPELTGRENIYLNGAILGMKRAEIRRKFDEIVAFAEVEKFIDTPVKHFSSGMHVRLAFAVAAHLEPEILLVDEVLAVGDAQFQRKCLGKMRQVGEEGRTILFVSHNMAAVRQLCSRGILLESGKMLYQGGQDKTIARYMETVSSVNGGRERDYHHAKGDGRAYITKIRINETMNGEPIIPVFGEINMTVDYIVQSEINELEFFVLIYSLDGDVEVGLFQRDNSSYFHPLGNSGSIRVSFKNCLAPGKYIVSAGIFDKARQFVDWVEHVESFYIESAFADGRKFDHRLGKTTQQGEWSVVDEKSTAIIQTPH